ncbi:MAG: UDP-N-acetylmuramoyl-tripeptide--D-alanyl-D-alanine ligase [Saprospiraceae bacterium]|nr:UDP-N-acetylmuramoyl-tripeptide--D-alanyl-D-alanine ligase [Saprospiraceae bacterium]
MDLQSLYQLFLSGCGISTDSRNVKKGDIFFALKGENFDGNQYALQSLQNGAILAVADDQNLPDHPDLFKVLDVLDTLQRLANLHRKQFSIPIIAITGSNGKTTTKELIASVLNIHYPTHFTKGNLNNHIGVPLTLLAMPLNTEIAVIEMGANHQGEINDLCHIAEPTHGLITNIGKAHLEGFGGVEGVKMGKSELFKYLKDGCIFLNQMDETLVSLSLDNKKKIIYTLSDQPDPNNALNEIENLPTQEFLRVAFLSENGDYLSAQTHLTGNYNLGNIMSAIAVGKYFKVPGDKVKMALENYVPSQNRSQYISYKGGKIILDAYNANPSSMEAALNNLFSIPHLNKIAILGDMFELGDEAPFEHKKIADFADNPSLSQVILIGKNFEQVASEKKWVHFNTATEAKNYFDSLPFSTSLLLIKGSRGMKLETLVEI